MSADSDSRTRPATAARRWRPAIWAGATLLLLLPLVAMQFTHEVAWGPGDFVAFGAMLAAACGAWELACRATHGRACLAAFAVAIATGSLLVWSNLAVGIIGSADDPANLMFAGVLAIAIAGAGIARLRPRGMARAIISTAAAQALVGVIAMVAGLGNVLAATGGFVALWLLSAWLFGCAARG